MLKLIVIINEMRNLYMDKDSFSYVIYMIHACANNWNNNPSKVYKKLMSGYLKIVGDYGNEYELSLTNYEVGLTFKNMVRDWFGKNASDYNDFIKSLLRDDVESMNEYMNMVADSMFSSFDGGKKPSEKRHRNAFTTDLCSGCLWISLTGMSWYQTEKADSEGMM